MQAVGAVLEQQQSNLWWALLGFFSKKLNKAQRNYSTFDRELLAIKLAIKHFEYFLMGAEFHVLTDHKPLVHIMHAHSSRSPLQSRCLSYISQFSTDIRYQAGEDNVVADLLSRPTGSVNAIQPYDSWKSEQDSDEDLRRLLDSPSTGLELKQIVLPTSSSKLWCDFSTGNVRPFVPRNQRQNVIATYHNTAHQGKLARESTSECLAKHGKRYW